jgi:hypothetical protein
MMAGLLLATTLLAATPAAAQAPAPLYPDLRTLPPAFAFMTPTMVDGENHRLLRFTASIWNAGPGPLELRGESSEGQTLAYQRIYDESGGFTERLVGQFVYHEGHHHWHFEHFAEYQLWRRGDYQMWLASGRQEGQPRWRSSKTTGQTESFCMRDSEPVQSLPGGPDAPVYTACDQELQGISVGWADTYTFDLPDQYIDLGRSRPPNGSYVLRIIADPLNLLYESQNGDDPDRESATANEATVALRIRGNAVSVSSQTPARD